MIDATEVNEFRAHLTPRGNWKMKLRIIKAPADILRQMCDPITEFDQDLNTFAAAMMDAMHGASNPKGIGLAANQVGRAIRLIVVHVPGYLPEAICNPVIEWAKGEATAEEQCLSEPGIRVRIQRAIKIRVNYQDLNGKQQSLTARDLLARCIQHEIDHLDGILISDHLKKPEALRARA